MFFFRKPKLVVDAFTSELYQHAFDYAPVDYATKFYPDWWKKLPKMSKPIFANNKGDVINTVHNILGGIRSTCTYINACNIKNIPNCTTFIRVNRQLNNIYYKYLSFGVNY